MTRCPICLGGCRWNGCTTPCGHRFHRTCLRQAGPTCPLCRRLVGSLRMNHCTLYQASFASRSVPSTPAHVHCDFELTITPKLAIVWANGGKWISFRRNHTGEYWSPIHGYLVPEPMGVGWGRPVIPGAQRSILSVPYNLRENVKMALRSVRN